MLQKRILFGGMLLLLYTGCAGKDNFSEEVTQGEEALANDDWLLIQDDDGKHFSGLETEEYISDLDYLYQQLQENYPFFGVAKRKADMDLDARFTEARKAMESCSNDVDCEFPYILQ